MLPLVNGQQFIKVDEFGDSASSLSLMKDSGGNACSVCGGEIDRANV
jgi:hypothetical protein